MIQLLKTSRWLKISLALIVPLLLYAVLAERASWRPHTLRYGDDVLAVAYSADGHWLACATLSSLELRDAHTKQIVWKENLQADTTKALAFAPDSRTLAFSRNNSLQLWDVPTHTLRHDLVAHYPYWHNATALFFTPDSTRLITGGDESQVLLWDARAGKLIRTMVEGKNSVPLALSADARTLALLPHDFPEYIQLWNVATRQPQHALRQYALRPPPGDNASCAAFAPDHKTLAMGTNGGQILLWDIATGRKTRQFDAHSDDVIHMTFSSDGQFLASSGLTDIKLWDARTGALLRSLPEPKDSSINALSFAADNATLAVAYGQILQLWRVQ